MVHHDGSPCWMMVIMMVITIHRFIFIMMDHGDKLHGSS